MGGGGIMDQVYQKGNTMGMDVYASARFIPRDVLAAMRMQKLAAGLSGVSPLHAINHFGDYVSDAASYGGVGGQVDPDTLNMMRAHAMSNIEGHVADRHQAAERAAAHPILSRVKGGVTGGLVGGLLGATPGMAGRSGMAAAIGGIAGLTGGALIGQHLTRPEAYANEAAHASAMHGAITDPAMNAALQREVADQHMQRIQEHELEAARSHGQYGQEARAKAKLYNTALKHELKHGDSSYDDLDYAWGKDASAIKVADAWGRQMAQMEKSALPGLGAITGALSSFGGRAMAAAKPLANRAMTAAKPFANKALTAAKANPALATAAVGAGVGAIGGAASAEKGHRLGGALKGGAIGGAVGGAAGYAAPKVMGHMDMGHSFGGAMKATGQEALAGAKGLGQRAMNWATPAAQ
jgi:hypothetical protein